MRQILAHKWYDSPKGRTGIVLCHDLLHDSNLEQSFKNLRARIGVVSGLDHDLDIDHIIDYGTSFSLVAALELFNYIPEIQKYKL